MLASKLSLQIEVEVPTDMQQVIRHQIEALIRGLLPDSCLQVNQKAYGVGLELCFLGQPQVWSYGNLLALRPRFYELLALMALHPEGLSSEQMSLCLYGGEGNAGCCRIELGRLKQFVPLESRPYRLLDYSADFVLLREHIYAGRVGQALELYRGPLLPYSQAPTIIEARLDLEEALRRAVLISRDPDYLWLLANRLWDDLELWEIVLDYLSTQDPRRALAETRRGRITGEWKIKPLPNLPAKAVAHYSA
jgi:hypothetical protein